MNHKSPATKKVDVARAFELHFKHRLGTTEIARQFGVTPQAISNALKPYRELMESPEIGDDQLSKMFKAASVAHLTEAVKPSKVKDLKADRNALAACMLLDKARLVAGQSTNNIGLMVKMVREACESGSLPPPPTVTEMDTEATLIVEQGNDNK